MTDNRLPKVKLPYDAELTPLTEEDLAGDELDIIPSLMIQLMRYETAIDGISQGVCFYDGDQKLVLSNRRYAEIYGIDPALLSPGISLKEVVELRQQVGSCPSATTQEYLSWCDSVNETAGPRVWNAELQDGRTIRVCHQSMEDHGWVSTHEDISDKLTNAALARERVSLQNLIDAVPDYLWLKDTNFRFIVANKALALDWGKKDPRELLGLSDEDYHSPERAKLFRKSEADIVASRTPMIDREEFVLDNHGGGKWLSSTKIPLVDEKDEVFAIVGIARDITARKRAEELRLHQSDLLERIADREALPGVLKQIIGLLEMQLDGVHGAVLELTGAEPHLVGDTISDSAALSIVQETGLSNGTSSAERGALVVIGPDEGARWPNCRELLAELGYHACWLSPVRSGQSQVSAVIMLFCASSNVPSKEEEEIILKASRIAKVAVDICKRELAGFV